MKKKLGENENNPENIDLKYAGNSKNMKLSLKLIIFL